MVVVLALLATNVAVSGASRECPQAKQNAASNLFAAPQLVQKRGEEAIMQAPLNDECSIVLKIDVDILCVSNIAEYMRKSQNIETANVCPYQRG